MYGASFDCGIEKTGDNHVFKFYLESLSDEFLPAKEDLSKKSIEILLDIVFNSGLPLKPRPDNAIYLGGRNKRFSYIIT